MQHCILSAAEPPETPVEKIVRNSEQLTAERHLEIYQSSYVARLRACMLKQFPALAYAMGPDLFQMFADEYLQAYPSSSYTLTDLGRRFPQFLEETRPDADSSERESWPDFLIQLAEFEYRLHVTFDEAEPNGFCPASVSSPDSRLRVAPICRLFEFRFPIAVYHSAFRENREPDLPGEQASWCAVFRNGYRLAVQGLTEWQFRLLANLRDTNNVIAAIRKCVEPGGGSIHELQVRWKHWRSDWISSGLLVQAVKSTD